MSKKTYIHRNVNMMLYSHNMSPLLCWHNNVQTKCSTVVLENILKNMSTLKNKKKVFAFHMCHRTCHLVFTFPMCQNKCPHKLCSHKSKIKKKHMQSRG